MWHCRRGAGRNDVAADLRRVASGDPAVWTSAPATRSDDAANRRGVQNRSMEPEEPGVRATASQQDPASPRDGLIDFRRFTLEQLRSLESTIDPLFFPLNHRNLREALAAHETVTAVASSNSFECAFSRKSGLAGWWSARRRGSPVYGNGGIEAGKDQVQVRGWQRTWLGLPLQVVIAIPAREICDVLREGRAVRFVRSRRRRFSQHFVALLPDEDAATKLLAALPPTRSAAFERRWEPWHRLNLRWQADGAWPWCTTALLALNLAVFLGMLLERMGNPVLDASFLLSWGANFAPRTADGQWWRLFTAMFVHLSPLHLLMNAWVLWNVGQLVERLFGRVALLGIYLGAGLLGGLASIAWNPVVVSAGASGAVFGLLGALLACLANRRSSAPLALVRAHWVSTVLFVLFNLATGAMQTGVDNAAHVGGLLSGFALGWLLVRRVDTVPVESPSIRAILASVSVFAVVFALGTMQARTIVAQPSALDRFWRVHSWYQDLEQDNIRRTQRLLSLNAAGQVTNADLASALRSQVLPFWRDTEGRLVAEKPARDAAERSFGDALVGFVRARSAWIEAVIAMADDASGENRRRADDAARKDARARARLERLALRFRFDQRSLGWSHGPLMGKLRGAWRLGAPECVRSPTRQGARVATTDARADGPAVRDRLGCEAQRRFLAEDYAGLDRLLAQHARALSDLQDGGSSLDGLLRGLYDLMRHGRLSLEEALGRTSDWRKAVPGSIYPELLEVLAFSEAAWAVRGTGPASSVSAQAWSVFKYRTAMAVAGLLEIAPRANADPWFNDLALDIGLDDSRPKGELWAWYEAASTKFPHYLPIHASMLRILMPRWGGSYREVDRLINRAYANGGRGLELYARLYWVYADLEGDELDLFKDSLADWSDVRSGFEELSRRHPRSDYLLNGYAYMACRAGDAAAYRGLRPRIDARYSASAWSKRFSKEACDRRLGKDSSAVVANGPAMMSWAQRLKQVFAIEIDTCARCQGRLCVIASIEEPELPARILAHRERSLDMAEPEHLPMADRAPPRQGLLL